MRGTAEHCWKKMGAGFQRQRTLEVQEAEAEACYLNWPDWEEQSLEAAAVWHGKVQRCWDPSC